LRGDQENSREAPQEVEGLFSFQPSPHQKGVGLFWGRNGLEAQDRSRKEKAPQGFLPFPYQVHPPTPPGPSGRQVAEEGPKEGQEEEGEEEGQEEGEAGVQGTAFGEEGPGCEEEKAQRGGLGEALEFHGGVKAQGGVEAEGQVEGGKEEEGGKEAEVKEGIYGAPGEGPEEKGTPPGQEKG
jgi:hypothetical protein